MTREGIIECPCYRVCSLLGVKLGTWCRYEAAAAPNPGMHRFFPEETWCPGGVQANVLMLGYTLANGAEEGVLAEKLGEVRVWVQRLRQDQPSSGGLDAISTAGRRK